MQNISKNYNPNDVESRLYNYWSEQKFFKSLPNSKPAYTIVIPPPNVTGVLHMGHMLNNTLQDILVRKARMSGFNACWVPGTDHASIATEAKVVNKLKNEGKTKHEIGREAFLKEAWDWTHDHGGKILEQLKHLGCSCDWDRTEFTLNKKLSESVIKTFIEFYNKGLIYRDFKMINWDPEAQTNISNEEVNYVEKQGKLYFLKYKVVDTDQYITIATTRPETIFGDNAICVNPNDERYTHLAGKHVIIPLVNRKIPVIMDEYVDIEFGTGVLKITPAHDMNDYEIGVKHNIEPIEIFNNDGTLNALGLQFEGKDRFIARNMIAKELTSLELLEKVEQHTNKVGTSERTGAVIEPKLSVQWFLKMEALVQPALEVVMDDTLKFYPPHFKKTYKHWLDNIHDWNISRQLWWGHQIPAYFYGNGQNDFVVAESIEIALEKAIQKSGNTDLQISNLKQDPDVLDTWFSSWLWPISVFNGINQPDNEEINYYYPTQSLVTGPDIIFFWVARMIMAGKSIRNQIPFENVYFNGLVRDNKGRKMSKQLGNSPDPIELMQKYGADGVRVGLMMSASAGNDVLFDEKLCLQGRNFATKIWNVFRLIKSWELKESESTELELATLNWYENKFNQFLEKSENDYSKFRISEVITDTYKLVWEDFSAWFLELIKPNFEEKISRKTYDKVIELLEKTLKVLHPFMPFITEEVWLNIKKRELQESITIAEYPSKKSYNDSLLQNFSKNQDIVSSIRNYRVEKNISPKLKLKIFTNHIGFISKETIEKLANIEFYISEIENTNTQSILVQGLELFVDFEENINTEEEKIKIQEEIKYLEGFLLNIEKKLSNKKFVESAPQKVVDLELKKKQDSIEKINLLRKKLNSLL